MLNKPNILRFAALGIALVAGACTGDTKYTYPQPVPGSDRQYAPPELLNQSSIFGGDGINFGNRRAEDQGTGIGVNALLWRATLDTISFMPIVSADPFGGVIITDWFTPTETPNERLKLNIFILGRELRADGVRVSVFRQRQEGGGNWVDAAVDPQSPVNIENAILVRARQIRTAGR
jgi:hypothetical protein